MGREQFCASAQRAGALSVLLLAVVVVHGASQGFTHLGCDRGLAGGWALLASVDVKICKACREKFLVQREGQFILMS